MAQKRKSTTRPVRVNKTNRSSKSKFKPAKYSPIKRWGVIFILLFAAVGAYALIRGFAAGAPTLNASNLDKVNSKLANVVTESTSNSNKKNSNVVEITAGGLASFSSPTSNLGPGVYEVCVSARATTLAASGNFILSGVMSTSSSYNVGASNSYGPLPCAKNLKLIYGFNGIRVLVNNSTGTLRVGIIYINKTADITPNPSLPVPPYEQIDNGSFETVCLYTRSASVDPIVQPGVEPSAHEHDFFGNPSLNKNSTAQSLHTANTTSCERLEDTAAYWVPGLFLNGKRIYPHEIHAYYNNERKGNLLTLPDGMGVVVGNSKATTPPDPADEHANVQWTCSDNLGSPPQHSYPWLCPAGTGMMVRLQFPNCWDGKGLRTPNFTYAAGSLHDKECPSTHPYPIPQVNVEFKYYTTSGGKVTSGIQGPTNNDPNTITLTSGPWYTYHGDFFNAWDVAKLQHLVDACTNAPLKCGGETP